MNKYFETIANKVEKMARENGKCMMAYLGENDDSRFQMVALYSPQYGRYKTFVLKSDMSDEALKVVYSNIVGRMCAIREEWKIMKRIERSRLS